MISIMGADGKSYGPVNAEQIQRWLAEGRASLQTQAQRQGEVTWLPLSEFPEFNPSLPPPIPSRAMPPLPSRVSSRDRSEETDADESAIPEGLLASRLHRLVASVIDTALSLFFALPGLFMLTTGILKDPTPLEQLMQNGFPGHESSMSIIMVGMAMPAIVQIFLLGFRGQTIGKLLLQMRIVLADDDTKAGFMRAVIMRGMIPALISTLPFIGFAFTLFNVAFIFRADRRCIHDHIAGTKVVRIDEAA